jgi:hypothetical protein
MSDLESGTYATSAEKVVTFWPAPDKDGTAEELWEDRFDNEGRSLGRARVKDNAGNVVKKYPVPEGFENRPSYDHSDNYVKMAPNGRDIYRNANGEAIGIQPGQAIVEYPDGRVEVLKDEYARYVFANAHEKVSADTTSIDARDLGANETVSDATPPKE